MVFRELAFGKIPERSTFEWTLTINDGESPLGHDVEKLVSL
jgi:hypothetical protein